MSDERPPIRVSLDDFSIAKYEVTNRQYSVFLSDVGNQSEGGDSWYRQDKYSMIVPIGDGFAAKPGFENFPVTNVSWYGAHAFAKWLSSATGKTYRLPTEAEWEFAARGGHSSKSSKFSGGSDLAKVGWCSSFAAESGTGWSFKNDNGVHPVGRKQANELGLHDMTGNVSEWCFDHYENRYRGGSNPRGPHSSSLRVLRGGSWDNAVTDCRITARNFDTHISRFAVNKGFRIVMEHSESTP